MRAPALAAEAAVEVVAEAVAVVALLPAMSVAWVEAAAVASEEELAAGEVLLPAATVVAAVVATAALPLVVTLLLQHTAAAVVVAMVEATATHLAPAATRGGRSITTCARHRHPRAFID